ncbi:hypothetical protein [Cohnella luojiensis]|uniref:Uncharacterized protein n=1 Tax=Cohnella luojiensis TaxID=652876 RepID=A0A4Y8LPX6_9BACL|nr:hypothetical protein [Cohnella luojiensis]TFE23376.1 hypothetical protein E2980_19375 [Cohnella luojiensis]
MQMPYGKRMTAPIALFVVILCALLVATPFSGVSAASAIELTAPVKADFDKAVASITDKEMSAKLGALYGDFGTLLKQDKTDEAKIKALHYRNEEDLILLRKQIRLIDADKLSKLGNQVKATKERYKPLFEAYTLVNKQITIARSLKNKALSALLRAQADALKLSVQFAREDIKAKEALYSSAKSATARTIKTARELLEAIDPLKVQIKAQRSAAKLPRSSLAPLWTNFKYAIKKREAKGTLDALSTLVMLARQIVDQQQKIYALEVRIGDIIATTKARYL